MSKNKIRCENEWSQPKNEYNSIFARLSHILSAFHFSSLSLLRCKFFLHSSRRFTWKQHFLTRSEFDLQLNYVFILFLPCLSFSHYFLPLHFLTWFIVSSSPPVVCLKVDNTQSPNTIIIELGFFILTEKIVEKEEKIKFKVNSQ